MQNMFLKFFCFQTVNFDFSQSGNSFLWGLKKGKLHVCNWKVFYVTQIHAWNFECKKCFWKSFVLKLWYLVSLKLALEKMKEFKNFEAYKNNLSWRGCNKFLMYGRHNPKTSFGKHVFYNVFLWPLISPKPALVKTNKSDFFETWQKKTLDY